MRRNVWAATACIVILASNFAASAATTYFVDPAGLDTNTGLSGSPFREIRKALT